MANQVKLTFAGEDKPLTDSFDRVGNSSDRMREKVDESGGGFDRAGEAADGAEGKAQGFSDVLAGTTDVAGGFGQVMKGDVVGGLIAVGGGMADLAGGFADFLIPALGKAKAAIMGMNFAFLSSPVFWVIAAVVALIAVIVLIATKTDWFQRAWRNSWSWIKNAASNTWDFIKKIPGWLQSAFKNVANFITAPYRAAFNGIARAWNATVGSLSWSVPGWIPFIGGKSISVPHLPTFHSGGIVPGPAGAPRVALLQGGEEVRSRASAGGGGDEQWIRVDLGDLGKALLKPISDAVKGRGGAASALGIRVVKGQVRA
jgi:hypothetical protein